MSFFRTLLQMNFLGLALHLWRAIQASDVINKDSTSTVALQYRLRDILFSKKSQFLSITANIINYYNI